MMDFSKPYALDSYFGNIDIYLFDQLLKGRIQKGNKILDAGCGGGRNLIFMMRQGFDLYGVDQQPSAINNIQMIAQEIGYDLPENHFKAEAVESMSFASEMFDIVISSAVLHFARDAEHFEAMFEEMWRVLKPGGIFFGRFATDKSIETNIKPLGNRRFILGDGSERFLANKEILDQLSLRLQSTWIEPFKTVNVDDMRAMSTICWKK